MDANEFLVRLAKIIKETGITKLSFTVADGGGYDNTITDVPGIFIGEHSDAPMVEDDEILIGGSEDDSSPHHIGGENDLLKEDS